MTRWRRSARSTAWLDLELTDAVATAMTQWLEENPSHKHGEHEYAPLDYGITRT